MKRSIGSGCDGSVSLESVEEPFVGPWTTDLVRCIVCQLSLFDAFRVRCCSKIWRDTIDFVMRERPTWAKSTLLKWLQCIGDGFPSKRSYFSHYFFYCRANLEDIAEGCTCYLCGKPKVWTHPLETVETGMPLARLCSDSGCALGMEIARVRKLCVIHGSNDSVNFHCAHCVCEKRCTICTRRRRPSQKCTHSKQFCKHMKTHCARECPKLVDVMPCFDVKHRKDRK